jgi:transcriptional regulator with XRE-family HTH domain
MPRAIQQPLSPLAALRVGRKLTRQQVSARMGLTPQRILQIEHAGTKDVDSLERLALIYDFPIQDLIAANKATRNR